MYVHTKHMQPHFQASPDFKSKVNFEARESLGLFLEIPYRHSKRTKWAGLSWPGVVIKG